MKQVVRFVKLLPMPLTGVMLGCAALGNLLQPYGNWLRAIFGCIAAIIFLLLLLKLIFDFETIKENMADPIMASVAATFPMAMKLLSVYAQPFLGVGAYVVWWIAITLHFGLIIYFTIRFVLHFQITDVYTTYIILYVGIAAISVTSPSYNMQPFGLIVFWISFIILLFLWILVPYRYIKYPITEPSELPLFCIFAAPANLCVVGYIQSASDYNIPLIIFFMVISIGCYLLVLYKLPSLLKLPFYPSYAAFTFPFVISAIGVGQSAQVLLQAGYAVQWMLLLNYLQIVIAFCMVSYTVVRYIVYLVSACKEEFIKK